jgi:hypothetical protein
MKKSDYEIGETAWCHIGNGDGLTDGKVIHIFHHGNQKLYIIEIDTHIDPVYVVREWWTMSKQKDRPIGAFDK